VTEKDSRWGAIIAGLAALITAAAALIAAINGWREHSTRIAPNEPGITNPNTPENKHPTSNQLTKAAVTGKSAKKNNGNPATNTPIKPPNQPNQPFKIEGTWSGTSETLHVKDIVTLHRKSDDTLSGSVTSCPHGGASHPSVAQTTSVQWTGEEMLLSFDLNRDPFYWGHNVAQNGVFHLYKTQGNLEGTYTADKTENIKLTWGDAHCD
jgi:hypothetical protein